MTKFFITRFTWETNKKGEQVKFYRTYTCKTNLLPSHKAIKNER